MFKFNAFSQHSKNNITKYFKFMTGSYISTHCNEAGHTQAHLPEGEIVLPVLYLDYITLYFVAHNVNDGQSSCQKGFGCFRFNGHNNDDSLPLTNYSSVEIRLDFTMTAVQNKI